MGYITEAALRLWENSQSTDGHTCHQFPAGPDAYARHLRWRSLSPQEQAEQEAPLSQAEQEEWDRLTAEIEERQREAQARVQALKHKRATCGIPAYNQYGGLA